MDLNEPKVCLGKTNSKHLRNLSEVNLRQRGQFNLSFIKIDQGFMEHGFKQY